MSNSLINRPITRWWNCRLCGRGVAPRARHECVPFDMLPGAAILRDALQSGEETYRFYRAAFGMDEQRPTKKEQRDGQEVTLVLCARCCQWTVKGDRCEHCRGMADWDKR